MVYRWREGYRASVPAQVAGERLAELAEANGGAVTPAIVVEDARPAGSPLHDGFEWDDAIAAERHREDQARRMLRNCWPVHIDADGVERPTLGYVHVDLPGGEPVYVTTARAVSEADLYEQVRAEAMAAVQALRRRYEHIAELEDVFRAIDRLGAPARRRQRRPAAARPAV
jgi:hypothetical protein